MSGGPPPAKVPTFGVRFDSYDDFLVEYTDHLRRGFTVLPLGDQLVAGSAVRLRIQLPDGQTLRVTGSVEEEASGLEGGEVRVQLDKLAEGQRMVLESCLHGGHMEGAVDDAGTARLEVLLVDDAVSVRLSLGDLMRARGFRVRVADNGLEALSAALKQIPHVILSDVEMPVMDGWKFLHMVRNRPRLAHVPFVFLTRLGDEMSRLRGYRMGVDDYLPKDTPPEEIITRVMSVADRRQRAGKGAAGQGLRGDLRHVRLGSVLAFLEAETRTGDLHLTHHDGDRCVMQICRGLLEGVDDLGSFNQPRDRVFQLLGWTRGDFEFFASEEREPDPEATKLGYLLLEHARREDEANAGI